MTTKKMKTLTNPVFVGDLVVLSRNQYDELKELAKIAKLQFPKPNSDGNYAALEATAISMARSVIKDRVDAGLSQKKLAELAGVRVETLCRIETGKHAASVQTIDKLYRVLDKHNKKRKAQK